MIVERQAGGSWGKATVRQLSMDLQREFPGVVGFSASNLWRMKGLCVTYQGIEKLAPLVREIGWSKNVLIHQIDNQTYKKSLLGQTNFGQALTPKLRAEAKLDPKSGR